MALFTGHGSRAASLSHSIAQRALTKPDQPREV
jgi:hypothetical protein